MLRLATRLAKGRKLGGGSPRRREPIGAAKGSVARTPTCEDHYRSFRVCPNLSLRDSHWAWRELEELVGSLLEDKLPLFGRGSGCWSCSSFSQAPRSRGVVAGFGRRGHREATPGREAWTRWSRAGQSRARRRPRQYRYAPSAAAASAVAGCGPAGGEHDGTENPRAPGARPPAQRPAGTGRSSSCSQRCRGVVRYVVAAFV